MGGKSSSNDDITKMQKEQATEARAKEAARQQRIDAGLAAIKAAFTGEPVNVTTHKTMKATGPGGTLPAGYSYVQVPGAGGGTAAATTQRSGSTLRGGGTASRGSPGGNAGQQNGGRNVAVVGGEHGSQINRPGGTSATSGGSTWKVQGPDGKLYNVGSDIGYDETVTHGRKTTGIDDKFYNEYNKGVQDYLLPQVYDQYGDATEKLTYDLARAGTSRSSAGAGEFADLAKQKEEQETDVRKTADTATGALRTRVANERAKAEAQLYATENPEVAANNALAAVKNISLDTPAISPLGQVFKTALVGGANALTGYKSGQTINDIRRNAAAASKVYV